jgi:hypothetical protein
MRSKRRSPPKRKLLPSQRYLIWIFPLDLTIVPPRKTLGS